MSAPRHIGEYRIVGGLGTGGMAHVYLAVTEKPSGFRKLLVLKVLRDELTDPEYAEMFQKEAMLAARLNHPHVVQTYEVGEVPETGQPYMAMEYLEGQPLNMLLAKLRASGGVPLTVYVRVLRDALDGLDYAHRLTDFDGRPLGIVHRDISPQNVLVTYAGHGKVLDFGIAKVTDSPLTEAGIIKGKAGYIAPEQVAGVSVDGRADVFAVGVMLWEGIANRRMVDRKLEDVAILTRRAEGAEPRIREVVPDAPSALADICDRALATSPRDRFASAAEMRDALEAWLRTREDAAEPRTIAALLETHFADDRTRIRKLIEQQISKTEAGGAILDVRPLSSLTPPARSRDPVKRDDALPDDVETVVPTASQARLARASREEVTRRFDTRRWTVLAAAAAVVVGGAALVGSRAVASRSAGRDRGTVEPIQRGAEPPASPGAAAAAAAAPRMVSVKIETTPRDAKVLLDGRPLGDAGGTGRLVADEVAHELRVEADGYAPKSRSVSLSADLNVIIHLEKAPRAPVVKGASEGVSPKQPPATSANAPSTGTPSGAASGGRGRLDWKDPWVN